MYDRCRLHVVRVVVGGAVTLSSLFFAGCESDQPKEIVDDHLDVSVEIVDSAGNPVPGFEFDYHFDMWIRGGSGGGFPLFYVQRGAVTDALGRWSHVSPDLDQSGACYTHCTASRPAPPASEAASSASCPGMFPTGPRPRMPVSCWGPKQVCESYLDGCYNPAPADSSEFPSVKLYPFDVDRISDVEVALWARPPGALFDYFHAVQTSVSEATDQSTFRRVDRFVIDVPVKTADAGSPLDAGRTLDAGRMLDAGEFAADGAITRDDAGRLMRHGPFDPRFPACNSPTCVAFGERCTSDSDCCQPGEWNDQRLCLGGYCSILVPGFDPVWHDPIPVCAGDGGIASPERR